MRIQKELREADIADWSREDLEAAYLNIAGHNQKLEATLRTAQGWNVTYVRQRNEAEAILASVIDPVRHAEHKVDQHLQGQYNELPYPALGVALASLSRG